MDYYEAQDKVIICVAEQFGIIDKTTITCDTKLVADLGAGSLDSSELIISLECDFIISIKDSDVEGLITVGHFTDLVCRKMGISTQRR